MDIFKEANVLPSGVGQGLGRFLVECEAGY